MNDRSIFAETSGAAGSSLFADLHQAIVAALEELTAAGALPAELAGALPVEAITVESPREAAHGDVATNVAMVLARPAGQPPRQLAETLAERLRALPMVEEVAVAGPGFLNLRLSRDAWIGELRRIVAAGEDYGRSAQGAGQRVNIEYVSANPTGPMHMGHCRGAVVGDALANLLAFTGHSVVREYYVNDAGGQVDTLARSAQLRYRQALGEAITIPEGLYPGDYLIPTGERLARRYGDRFRDAPEEEWLALFRREAVSDMMALIRTDLALLGIHHDRFASEAELHQAGRADAAEAELRARGLVYDGVLEPPKGKAVEDWEPTELPLFRSTRFGDDQDRPIRKADGSWTYFGADLAYHWQKAADADALIDIWGADHAGTVKRIKAAVEALTGGKPFDVKLVQMVRLLRDGEPVKMSKRSGDFVTLAEVVEEVGRDAVRFTMLTRKADAQMDFDFAKVLEASRDNPVFYVQYAHARISSTRRKAAEQGLAPAPDALDRLGEEELQLVKLAATFPRIVEAAARAREPHRIAFYLHELAAAFHAFWNLGNDRPDKRIILGQDPALSAARLYLADAIGQIIRNGLSLMGVVAVETM